MHGLLLLAGWGTTPQLRRIADGGGTRPRALARHRDRDPSQSAALTNLFDVRWLGPDDEYEQGRESVPSFPVLARAIGVSASVNTAQTLS